MQPLLKWPGGKTKEFEFIKDLIPAHKKYIEPFFGGGAVFFRIMPKKAVINDVADELIDFYRFIKGELNRKDFEKELCSYSDIWDNMPKYMVKFDERIIGAYKKYSTGNEDKQKLTASIEEIIHSEEAHFNSLFSKEFCIDEDNLVFQIKKNLSQKLIRTAEIEKKIDGGFLPGDLEKNIETGFRSGLYMHCRDLLNFNGEKYSLSKAKEIANWFFIREYCYGAMFRYNASGKFNIPYGGIGYNRKNLRKKIDHILSKQMTELFSTTEIYKLDFEELMKRHNFTENDFMFLDPPYDTDFSSYEGNIFGKGDQERLANALFQTKAKWIMIIKDTDYISKLYRDKNGIIVESFEKRYLYNVKGRNDRDVNHLIIRNFQADNNNNWASQGILF